MNLNQKVNMLLIIIKTTIEEISIIKEIAHKYI